MDNVLLSFTPALSKKLIAKGVSALPEVQKALTQGKILIGAGTTTAQIYLELGGELSEGAALACGMITSKGLCVGHGMTDFVGTHGHAKFWLLDRGQMVQSGDLDQALQALSSGDVLSREPMRSMAKVRPG